MTDQNLLQPSAAARPRGRSLKRNARPARKQIGIRLQNHHYRIAQALALHDGRTLAKVLEPLLEEELLNRQKDAEKIAKELADLVGSTPAKTKTKNCDDEDQPGNKVDRDQPVSLRIDQRCFVIAKTLAVECGSVPKVCEPLLEQALERNQREATAAAQQLVRQLKQQRMKDPIGR